MNTAEPDIPKLGILEVENNNNNNNNNNKTINLPGVHHVSSKLIQASGGKLYEQMHKLVILICNKEELPQEYKLPRYTLLFQFTRKEIK